MRLSLTEICQRHVGTVETRTKFFSQRHTSSRACPDSERARSESILSQRKNSGHAGPESG